MTQAISAPANAAAATAPRADASTPPASAKHDVVLNDADAIVGALRTDPEPSSQAAAQDQPTDPAAQPDGEMDQATGTQAAANDGETGEPRPESIPTPQSWTQDAKEQFAKLPPDLQKFVAKREAEREALLGSHGRELAQARQNEANLVQYAQTQLEQALDQARAAIEGEFAGINWLEIKKRDPNAWAQLDAMYQERLQAVSQAVKQHEALAHIAEQKRQQEAARHLHAQMQIALPEVAKIAGDGFEAKKWGESAVSYLKSIGCPDSHINGITDGYQMTLIAKAMQYDAMRTAAEAAKQKIAQAPKMLKPESTGAAFPGQDAKRHAMAALRKNPKDTDAIVAALRAAGG